MYSLLRTYTRFENTAITQANLLEMQTQRDFAQMRLLEKEKQTKMLELAKSIASDKTWGFVSLAAQTAISASSLALGAVALTKESTRTSGLLLLSSGVASVANRIFSFTGAFKKAASWFTQSKEMQEKIASRLELGGHCLSAGLGALGALSVYRSENMSDTMAKVKSWVSSPLLTLGSRAIDLKRSWGERQSKHTSAFLMHTESLIIQIFHRIHQSSKDAERLVHTISDICEALKQAVASLYAKN